MDSPEDKKLVELYPRLVGIIEQSPDDVTLHLKPYGILAPRDEAYLGSERNEPPEKAKRIVDIVIAQVKYDSKLYCTFIEALEAAGPWTSKAVKMLKQIYEEQRIKSEPSSSATNYLPLEEPQDIHKGVSHSSSSGSTSTSGIDIEDTKFVKISCECGQCTLLDYISGVKECADSKPPKIKIWTPDPPYDENRVTSTELSYRTFKTALLKQTQHMHNFFCSLLVDTFTMLEERVKFNQVKSFTQKLLTPGMYYKPLYKSSADKCLDKIAGYEELCQFLQDNYCSWFNYEIIETLRKEYLFSDGGSDDEKLLNYEHKFLQYVGRRCFIYVDDFGTPPQEIETVEISFKMDIDIDEITYEQISYARLLFITCLKSSSSQLSEYNLTFKNLQEGCTKLVFRAPEYVENIPALTQQQIFYLKENKFLEVIFGNRRQFMASGATSYFEFESTGMVMLKGYSGSEAIASYGCTTACTKELELVEEMELAVSPCSLWKASHSEQYKLAVVYSKQVDDTLQFSEFINNVLYGEENNPNVMKASCVHQDYKLSPYQILIFEPEQSLKDFCISRRPLSEIEQLSILRDVGLGALNFSQRTRLSVHVTIESIFVHVGSSSEISALFFPLYDHSCYSRNKSTILQKPNKFQWIKDILLLMNYSVEYSEHSELPCDHVLYSIFKYKWFANDEKNHPKNIEDITEEIDYILDLVKTRQGISDTFTTDSLEVSHLHMLLIGHSGVGKTSVCKHLQNIRFDENEKSTIIMQPQILYQEAEESSSSSYSMIFQKSKKEYENEQGKLFLTLWDTGGQPMFQDLLPCFARLRSIYGIVFRSDLEENSTAIVRSTCSFESTKELPYTYMDDINRCFAFLDFFSSSMYHDYGCLPSEVKETVFESIESYPFPVIALIGTFKDKFPEDEIELSEKMRENLKFLQVNFLPSNLKSGIFEIDNTKSGDNEEDYGIVNLREQIAACTKNAKAKIPIKWLNFKNDLEYESQLQLPCTGILTYKKVAEIAKQHGIDPQPPLCYFHELGIFLWYHEKESLRDYVIIKPENLVNILGTVFNPKMYEPFREQWKQLRTQGILTIHLAEQLLDNSKTGLPLRWILSFFEEHHLATRLDKGYFIPSMLQMPQENCCNFLHVYDVSDSACISLIYDSRAAAPLFLVPKCKCIPPGFFPRLMTVLAAIQDDELVWKLLLDGKSCKTMVTFVVNDQANIFFTEFVSCVRIRIAALPNKIISRELCQGILMQLRIQLQRVFPQASELPVSITFACFCSSKPHFLPSFPSTTEDFVYCDEQPTIPFSFTTAHKMWIKKPAPKTEEDAKRLLEDALDNGFVSLRISTMLFTGSTKTIFFVKSEDSMQDGSNYYIFDSYKHSVRNLHSDDWLSYLANSAAFPARASAESEVEILVTERPVINLEDDSEPEDQTYESISLKSTTEVSSALAIDTPSDMDTEQSESAVVETITPTLDLPESVNDETQNLNPIENDASISVERDHTAILNMMYCHSEERQQLNLLHAIESSQRVLLKILPLLSQPISIGVIDTEHIEILESIHHISKKWMIVQAQSEQMTTAISTTEIVDPIKHKLLLGTSGSDIVFPMYAARNMLNKMLFRAHKKRVPCSWYYLCYRIRNSFRETKRKVISYSEVSQLCHLCRIQQSDLTDVLDFLHVSGLLVYFKTILPNQVLEDISVLISILEAVLKNKDLYDSASIVTEDDFRAATNLDGVFNHVDAIELFKGLFLIFQIDQQLFSIPYSIEISLRNEELSHYCKQSPNLPFLLIQYPTKDYIFAFLICFVTSNHKNNPWPWKLSITEKPVCLFKNCAQFILPGYNCIITLFASDSFIEAHVYCMDNKPPLSAIRSAIVAGLEEAHNSFHLTEPFNYKTGFFCPCGSIDKKHLVTFSEKTRQWICSESLEEINTISRFQQNWFNNDIPDQDSVTIDRVFIALLPQCETWFQVGIDLGLDTQTLSRISVKHKDRSDIALMEVVRYWFQNNPSPNWKVVESLQGSQLQSEDHKQPGSSAGPMGITHILNQIIIDIKGVADVLEATESSERLVRISSDLQHFIVKVGFIGLTNSGKSTTLNALLGQTFLPTAEQRGMVCPVHIQHDSNQNHPGTLFGLSKTDNSLAKLESGSQLIRSKIKELNKKAHEVGETGYAELVLRAPILCLAGKEMTKYEIYDTPGVSERKESVATTQANHALKGTAAVVLVISPDSADFESLTDFTDQIKQAHPSMMEEQSRIVVLINKHDKCYLVDEIVETYTWDPDTLKQYIGKQIAVPPEQIICFSALFALRARILKQDPSAYKERTYKILHAELSKTPERKDIHSLEECLAKPEKLIDACEKFSNVVAVEKVLCKKLFSNEQVLLESSVDDSCCEIDKIKTAIVEKIEGLEIEMNKLKYLIQQINEFLNDCCRISSSFDDTLQNCKEILKGKALNLESEINSKASEKVASDSSLQGQYEKSEELRDRIKNKCRELKRFTEASIKELWNSGIQEMKRKLTMELETVLSKLKKDLVATHLSSHFNFESVDPDKLLESCSFPPVIQPAPDQFANISDAAMDTLVLRRTVTKQRNETKEGRVSTGLKYLIAGPRTHKTYLYNVVVDYQTIEYEVDKSGFIETFKQLAKESANFVYKNLETVLTEQTSKLSQVFLGKLQHTSKQPLRGLNDELEKKVKDCQELDKQTKFLDNKRKELTSVLKQIHSQQALVQGSTPSSKLPNSGTKDTLRKREHPTDSQGSPPPTESKKQRLGDYRHQ